MSNSGSLKGKEFIDFLFEYLSGRSHEPEKKPGFRMPDHCKNELKADEAKKLLDILTKDEELMYYFNAKNGFKALVDSLFFGFEGLLILEELLPKHTKLREDFQRQHLYEGLIDFIYRRNVKIEGAILPNEIVHRLLTLLENGSLNEVVRGILSEKTKIKDLFLIVFRSVEITENMLLISSLIQFVSNLCYGTGKFRVKLASEPPSEFMNTLNEALQKIKKSFVCKEDKTKTDWKREGDRTCVKFAILNFVVNLLNDPKLRQHIANNMGNVLATIFEMLQEDVDKMSLNWEDSVTKELAVCINAGLEMSALKFYSEHKVVQICETLLKELKFSKADHKELIARTMNVLAKVTKVDSACVEIVNSKSLIVTIQLYYRQTESDDLSKQCLLAFHQCCRRPDFKEVCFDKHKLTASTFDGFVKQSIVRYTTTSANQDWANFVNACASITQFVAAFPERSKEYKELIKPLIKVVSDKTDAVRKQAA
jgi:hypothetical protein